MFEYFYHEILRRTVISFGTLFNGIAIQKKDSDGDTFSTIEVPLAYGPKQKFLARIEQSPDLNRPVQMSLPRMSFEMIGISYDSSRKVTNTQSFLAKSKDNSQLVKTYVPVPYNIEFELAIMTKLNDDMLQIVEQILPYFQPSFNLTIDLNSTIGEKKDVPVILSNLNMQDDYEGDYSTRRSLVYTLRFIAKTYLFGPTSADISTDIIKKVSIGFNAGSPGSSTRDLRYAITPVAVKNYTGNSLAVLNEDINSADELIKITTSQTLSEKSYFTIDNETMYLEKIINSTELNLDEHSYNIRVQRSQYETVPQNHVAGTDLFLIDSADHQLIEPGDDFGFSMEYS